jgi:hypothetical protein
MNLEKLRWTKNVNDQGFDKYWAYQNREIDCKLKIFLLNWNKAQKSNASKPEEDELVILRQRKKVTHIVKFLNNTLYDDGSGSDFGIGRLVQVIWMTDDWNIPPKQDQDEIFGFQLHLQGGNIMEIKCLSRSLEYSWGIAKFSETYSKRVQA